MPDEIEITPDNAMATFADLGLDPGEGIGDHADNTAAGAADASLNTNGEAARASAPPNNDNNSTEANPGAQAGATAAQAAGPAPAEAPGSRASRLAQIKDPAMAAALKYASNQSFEHFFPLALKLQNGALVEKATIEEQIATAQAKAEVAAKEATAARYFDHEEGYKLTPEYIEAKQVVDGLTNEQELWIQQATAIEQGQPFYWLQANAKGETQWTGPYNPKDHPGVMARVQAKISQATGLIQQHQSKLQSLPEAHKTQYTQINANLTQMDTKLFGNIKNQAFHDKTASYLKQFPAFMQGRPEVALLAKALAGGELLMAQNAQLREQLSKGASFNKAMSGAAPNPNAATNGALPGNDQRAALDMLHRMADRP